jgi:hypothetical protein
MVAVPTQEPLDPLSKVAERRILEALAAGELEQFHGKGQPMPPEDDLANVPEDLRAGYRLLKSHGFVPEEVDARRGLLRLDDLIAACADPAERGSLQDRRRREALKLSLLLERRGVSAAAIETLVSKRV